MRGSCRHRRRRARRRHPLGPAPSRARCRHRRGSVCKSFQGRLHIQPRALLRLLRPSSPPLLCPSRTRLRRPSTTRLPDCLRHAPRSSAFSLRTRRRLNGLCHCLWHLHSRVQLRLSLSGVQAAPHCRTTHLWTSTRLLLLLPAMRLHPHLASPGMLPSCLTPRLPSSAVGFIVPLAPHIVISFISCSLHLPFIPRPHHTSEYFLFSDRIAFIMLVIHSSLVVVVLHYAYACMFG